MFTEKDIPSLKHRYRNAKRRALYWSGNPSYSASRTRETRSSRLCEKYEIAMSDCKNLEQLLERLTGASHPHYDPQQKFRNSFFKP